MAAGRLAINSCNLEGNMSDLTVEEIKKRLHCDSLLELDHLTRIIEEEMQDRVHPGLGITCRKALVSLFDQARKFKIIKDLIVG